MSKAVFDTAIIISRPCHIKTRYRHGKALIPPCNSESATVLVPLLILWLVRVVMRVRCCNIKKHTISQVSVFIVAVQWLGNKPPIRLAFRVREGVTVVV